MEGLEPERVWRWRGVMEAAVCGLGLVAGLTGCAAGHGQATRAASVATTTGNAWPGDSEALDVVECRLPRGIDRLGQQLTKLSAGQQVRSSRDECIARKGEVMSAAPAAGSGAPGTVMPPR